MTDSEARDIAFEFIIRLVYQEGELEDRVKIFEKLKKINPLPEEVRKVSSSMTTKNSSRTSAKVEAAKKRIDQIVDKPEKTSDLVEGWLARWNALGETDQRKCPCGCGFTHGQHRMLSDLFTGEDGAPLKECPEGDGSPYDWVN